MTSSEQARADASHACDACGGNGYHVGHEFCTGWREAEHRCPVCRGAGRISDRMPAADALADAETLRLYVAVKQRAEAATINMGEPAPWTAMLYDLNALFCRGLSPAHYGLSYALEQDYFMGKARASAAFRAVPGLRGEE